MACHFNFEVKAEDKGSLQVQENIDAEVGLWRCGCAWAILCVLKLASGDVGVLGPFCVC